MSTEANVENPVLTAIKSSPSASPVPSDEDKTIEGPIICPGHARQIPDIHFSQVFENGLFYMLSACVDGKPMLRDGATGDWIGTFESHKGAVWCCRLNKTADLMVSASADYTAKFWDATSGEVLYTWEHKGLVRACAFSQDGAQIYTGGNSKKILIFDASKPEAAPTELAGHSEGITHIGLCSDPNLIMSVAREKDIFVWDKRTGLLAKKLPTDNKITSLSLTYDMSTAATTSGKSDVCLWNTSTLERTLSITLPKEADCVAYDPASRRLLAASQEEWVRCYSDAGVELSVYKGHHGPVRSLAVNPSSLAFASGSDDSTIRIWDWPRELAVPSLSQ